MSGVAASIMRRLLNKRHNNGGGGATDSTSMRGDENGGSFGAHIEISHKTPHGDLIVHPLQLYT